MGSVVKCVSHDRVSHIFWLVTPEFVIRFSAWDAVAELGNVLRIDGRIFTPVVTECCRSLECCEVNILLTECKFIATFPRALCLSQNRSPSCAFAAFAEVQQRIY